MGDKLSKKSKVTKYAWADAEECFWIPPIWSARPRLTERAMGWACLTTSSASSSRCWWGIWLPVFVAAANSLVLAGHARPVPRRSDVQDVAPPIAARWRGELSPYVEDSSLLHMWTAGGS